MIAAAGEILRVDTSTTETVALAMLFILLGSSSVVAVAALGTFAPRRSAPTLGRLHAWLTVHNKTVITAIIVLFGVALTIRGLTSLT